MTMSEDPFQDAESSPNPISPPGDIQQELPQPVKRKGGRKPVYTTVQERKQRNRMAQAAFRERRTEYIKQLEDTLKDHEELIQHLQRNSRETTEECHMLRYKTSLLEDVLLENGIDYQSELQARSSRSLLSSPYASQYGNKQTSTAQSSPNAEPTHVQGFADGAAPSRHVKRKSKSSSLQGFDPSPSHSYDLKPESSAAARGLTNMMSSLESAGIVGANLDYSNGAAQSMESALECSRFRIEDGRIDPSISAGEAGPFYSMVSPNMGMHLDRERESRPNQLDHRSSRPFRYDGSRADAMRSNHHVRTLKDSQTFRSPTGTEHSQRIRQHAHTPTSPARPAMYGRNGYLQAAAMDLAAVDLLDHPNPLGENFELPTTTLG